MRTCALVRDGAVLRLHPFNEDEELPVLAANKGVWLPVEEDHAECDPATQVLLDPVTTVEEDRVVVGCPVREKTPLEVAAMREAKVAEVKAEASARILALYPAWKQTNMLARGVELASIRVVQPWTPEEEAESALLLGRWAEVKAIRELSDALEASIPQDAAGIAAFDPSQGWD